MSAKVALDPKFRRKLSNALHDTSERLRLEFRKTIESPIFENSRGELVDIVDTGAFRDSLAIAYGEFTDVFTWYVFYAAYLYFGYATRSGAIHPPRNWIAMTFRNGVDPLKLFAASVKRRAGS